MARDPGETHQPDIFHFMGITMNLQTIEHRVHSTNLDVVEVFYTIQGEGPHSGRPSIFVRLAGCNLQCPLCDTDYTSIRRKTSLLELLGVIESLRRREKGDLIVLTGGEPLRQNTSGLIASLVSRGHIIQIETNGTYPTPIENDPLVQIVCSPKTPQIHPQIMRQAVALKYVIENGYVDPVDGLPTSVLGKPCRPARPMNDFTGEIYISPADCLKDTAVNKANIQAAVNSCLQFGYRISLQTHKLLGVR